MKKLRFLTAGESHGQALIGIIEGIPSGLSLDKNDLQAHMRRRKKGFGRGERQKIETDEVCVLSGVRFGKTMGTPIGLSIKNKDYQNWEEVMSPWGEKNSKRRVNIPRPGHSDFVGGVKFSYDDLRNALERASARETAVRVALSYFAKSFLESLGVKIYSRVSRIGGVVDKKPFSSWKELSLRVEADDLHCFDRESSDLMKKEIERAIEEKDTLGGEFEIWVSDLPIGLGSYTQWDRKLEASIGESFLSLNGIKSVEIGLGKKSSRLRGSEVHDELYWDHGPKLKTNKSGGLLSGVTTGSPLHIRASMKPIATLMKPLKSFDWKSREEKRAHIERSDYCAVPSACIIGESLACLCVAEAFLQKFGGDSLDEILLRLELWKKTYQN